MQLPFDPEIHLGPLSLAWHGIFTVVGIFLGVWLAARLLRGRVHEDAVYSVATWGVVGGIVGARLLHVADCWEPCGYAQDPLRILQVWTGGIAVWGAAIGGVVGGVAAAIARRDVPIGLAADAAASGLSLGFGIGRIGDVINGEHHALTCDGAPGVCVEYTNPATLGQGSAFPPLDRRFAEGPVHLVVLYDMIWDLLGVGLVLFLRRQLARRVPDGTVFWIWAFWYGVGRLALGFLRIGEPYVVDHLRQDQVVALGAMALAPVAIALLATGVGPRALSVLRRAGPV